MKPEKRSILEIYFHYLRHRFINQKKKNVKTGVHIFTKIKNTDGWRQKNFFQLFHFRNS